MGGVVPPGGRRSRITAVMTDAEVALGMRAKRPFSFLSATAGAPRQPFQSCQHDQALRLQYNALKMFAVLPWPAERAQYDFFFAGWSFLMLMLASPNLTSFTLSPFLAKTADFFPPELLRFGLL